MAISGGNSVSLAAAIKAGETLTVLGTPTWNSTTGVLSIPYTDEAGVLQTRTVVVNPTFVVGNAQDLVGDTSGTVRNTITEVISGGNTTYTIKSDLPLATSVPSGGTNDLVYDAVRGGWYVDVTYPTHTHDRFVATANQTVFTLSKTPIGTVQMFRFGHRKDPLAITVSGTTVTWNPAASWEGATYGELVAGDVIVFDYEAL